MNENNLWLKRWESKEIGFNQNQVNGFMLEYFERLNLAKGENVLVPLCGKTIDISWLLAEGYQVTGIELSQTAVVELFEELNLTPSVSQVGELTLYSTKDLKVYVGDFFKVTAKMLGQVDGVYDRASIVALTKDLRVEYAKHLREITNNASQLLLCFEYNQELMNRTPYSVDEEEVKKHYAEHYDIILLQRIAIEGGFKGKLPACDVVWLLRN